MLEQRKQMERSRARAGNVQLHGRYLANWTARSQESEHGTYLLAEMFNMGTRLPSDTFMHY